ncbi:RNAPII transcription regulator C-terminal-domain-containing protein [Halteromyces radiatus]|uniref:RNAPII transcription regulator C-terminal-domain-containing protein n=1 Tax=Halteromyces radiatus TaxID=101107 RepID=UPI00221F216F|nr:RNAPII transcription regulator C-terminal-domain-containing protein [Halteromyces radiatus]KAI8089741.1 RNAPII transcription regulator C-terminal-domain-containing protein [Halteromyces radiatus]
MLDRLIEWCYTDDLGSEAATGIAVILHQDEMILNRKSHATISILYRQRIFHHCAPRLIAHQNDLYCLVALSHILVHTPTQVPASEISKLLPAMTQALRTVDHEELVLSMMEVAQSIIPFENSNDSQQLNSLLDALLALTIDHDKTKIRRNALRCLSRYAQVAQSTKKIEMLRLYVPKVIKRLGMALDDKKRLVRKEAVDCREQWYMLLLLLDNGK